MNSLGDGITINLQWFQAFPDGYVNQIAYHIYYSTIKENVFTEGVKFVSIDGSLEANIIGLTPGQEYFFSVRPVEYDPIMFDLKNTLPIAYDNLRVYPQSILRQDITATSLIIPLADVEGFPNTGVIKVGVELIQYLAVDSINNNLVLTNISQRGFDFTPVTFHTVAGFDGYVTWDPTVVLWTEEESEIFDRIFACQSRFEYPNYQFTLLDGYHQVNKDLLSTDLSAADAANVTFPMFDFAGFHRTDPVQLLNGTCVGSYIGGEMGCIDGYGNVNILRGLSLQDQNTQRQDVLLSVTGIPAVLIRRVQTGITCACYQPSSEYPDDRCPKCFGTKFVLGYEQYYNPRRSDGRILVRPGPTAEGLRPREAGLESDFPLDLWTLTVPTIKMRDILVLFDQDDNESFRYEVADVIRNDTILGLDGAQHLKTFRIRKYDVAYQIDVFRNTSMFPTQFNTGITSVPGAFPPHSHVIVRNEHDSTTWQQLTSVAAGHNHEARVVNGQLTILPVLGHTHSLIL